MIQINDIEKKFGDRVAVNRVSLEVKKGELFGLIGPDGAGKTTLFKMITTLLLPDSGNIRLNGLDVVKDYREIRNILGYMPGKFSLYQDLSVRENLEFFAGVFGNTVKENYNLIRDIYVHIEPFSNRPAGKLSGGMKQKLALSCALIHRPQILVLDEPTTGVDAVSRKEFWEMIYKIQSFGITVIASTPYMDEAQLCNRVAFMQAGNILTIDTPRKITESYPRELIEIKSDQLHRLVHDLRSQSDCHSAFLFGQGVHYTSTYKGINRKSLVNELKKRGHQNLIIEKIIPGIEDAFMEFLQKEEHI